MTKNKMSALVFASLFSFVPDLGKMLGITPVKHKEHKDGKAKHIAGYSRDLNTIHPSAFGKHISAYKQYKPMHALRHIVG
jgi:hypothetical protein